MAPRKVLGGRLVRDDVRQRKPGAAPAKQGRPASKAAVPRPQSPVRPLASKATDRVLPLELYQRLLDVFCRAFPALLDPAAVRDVLLPAIQKVKGFLYERDFAAAFAQQAHLDAYTIRWSASRALAYLEILHDLAGVLEPASGHAGGRQGGSTTHANAFRAACLGGTGAEACAFAGFRASTDSASFKDMAVDCFDVADWSRVFASLYDAMEPALGSDEASLVGAGQGATVFHRADLLRNGSGEERKPLDGSLEASDLVTLLFTLNELFTESIPRTQTLLLDLTSKMRSGAFLLVVDSPGSYSTVTVNGNEKKYPMAWLLDHTLLKTASALNEMDGERGTNDGRRSAAPAWEKLEPPSTESRWFRLPQASSEKLEYPIELENMRYQMHLYRRVRAAP